MKYININEGLNPGKLNRIKKKLEVDMRQMKSRSGTDSEKLNRMIITRDALDEIATNPDILNIRVSGVNNKFLNMLRQEKISLRTEVLKSEPDLETIASKYLRVKSLMRLTQDRSAYDTQQAAQIKENSNRYYITRPIKPSSERNTDLQAMYGDALELKGEDKESYEEAKEYLKEDTSMKYVLEGNLFDNIRAKRDRIAKGSGEKKAKPGDEDWPEDLEKAAKESKKNLSEMTIIDSEKFLFGQVLNSLDDYSIDKLISKVNRLDDSKIDISTRKKKIRMLKSISMNAPKEKRAYIANKFSNIVEEFEEKDSGKNIDLLIKKLFPIVVDLVNSGVKYRKINEGKETINEQRYVSVNEALAMPKKGEEKNDFISRFMSSELAKKEFPENKQRVAVAYSQWQRDNKINEELSFLTELEESYLDDLINYYDNTSLTESIDSFNKRMMYKYNPGNYVATKQLTGKQLFKVSAGTLAGGAVGLSASIGLAVLGALTFGVGYALPLVGFGIGSAVGANATLKSFGVTEQEFIDAVGEEASSSNSKVKSLANQIGKEFEVAKIGKRIDKKKVKELFKLFKKELKESGIIEKVREKLDAENKNKKANQKRLVVESLKEEKFKVSLVNQGSAPSTGTVKADNEDEAITKAIDAFDVDVDNIESVEKLKEFKINFGSGLKPLNEAKEKHPMIIKYGVEGFNKPKATPSHKTKSHLVVAKKGEDVKVVRFGAQGVKGSPKKDGESEAYRKRRQGFVARHKAQNPEGMKDKFSPLYWANKVKW
jgi:hypothetical protein